jgi:hypothetical protein
MSFIQQQFELAPLASGNIEFRAGTPLQPTLSRSFHATGQIQLAASASTRREVTATGQIQFSTYANLTEGSEPTMLLSATGALQFAAAGAPKRTIKPYAEGNIALAAQAAAALSAARRADLHLTVEILPVQPSGNYQNYDARLKISGAVVPIASYEETKSETEAGKTISKSLIAPGASVVFEIDFGAGAGWTEVLRGKLSAQNYSLANENGAPADRFQFTTADDLNDRLGKSPENDLIVYDSARTDEMDASEFEPVYDTAGRAYTPEVLGFAGLMLYDLFDEILVGRCGFAGWKTNLPDFPVRRADFLASGNFWDGIKPLVGEYEPLTFADANNIFWIVEGTNLLPAGFPAPLSRAGVAQISSSADFDSSLEGFELQFSESEEGDYFTRRIDNTQTETKTRFGRLISRVTVATTVREYRSQAAPGQILREAVEKTVRTTYGQTTIFPAAVETENFEFDYLGRQKRSVKTVQKRIPNLAVEGAPESLQTLSEEEQNFYYAPHPFKAGAQILRRTELIERGKAAVDAENQYLGADFAQRFLDAHRAGNLNEEMEVRDDVVLKTIVEDFRPLPNGQVQVYTTIIDHTPELLDKAAIVTTSIGEPRAGDVSVSARAGRARKMRVYESDDYVPVSGSSGRVEPFAVGELPLHLAIPLARRRLKKRRFGKAERISAEIVGWDQSLREGSILTIQDRESNTIVTMIVEGWTRFARRTGENSIEFGTSLRGSQI